MKVKLSKQLTALLTALVLISCFAALYNVELTSATPAYAVVFMQYDLPSGTSWSVTFDGSTQTGTTNSITFTGFGWHPYSYSITAQGYAAIPSSGTVTPTSGNPIPIYIEFIQASYELDLSAGTGGTTSPPPCSYYCTSNQIIDITAVPDAGYRLLGWEVNGVQVSNNDNPLRVIMNGNYRLQPIFAQNTYSLIVLINGQGTVNPGNSTYVYGENVNLKATAADGWTFTGWNGDATGAIPNANITIDGMKFVVANFIQDQCTLTMQTVGQGTVTPGNQTYAHNELVTLTATPADRWIFSGWSGDAQGTTNTTILMDTDKTVTANFTNPYRIHVIGGNISESQFSEEFSVEYYQFLYEGQTYSSTVVGFTVTGTSGDYGTATLVIPKCIIPSGSLNGVNLDGLSINQLGHYSFSEDTNNYYFTFSCHFSTHTFTLEFSDEQTTPTPTPIDTPTPTATPAPTTSPTTTPTTTPTITPAPTATPATPTITPAPTATAQPTATTQPTTTNDLTLPIAGAVILLVLVLAGLVIRKRKQKP